MATRILARIVEYVKGLTQDDLDIILWAQNGVKWEKDQLTRWQALEDGSKEKDMRRSWMENLHRNMGY